MYSKYASVILEISIDKTLDYGIPDSLKGIEPGTRVEVPVRGFPQAGFVMEVKTSSNYPSVQPIKRTLSEGALISPDLFRLSVWMARYYCSPLRQVLKQILPAPLRKGVKPKQQLYVMRGRTKEALKDLCIQLREKHPLQANVLDVMLQVRKGILLTELLEETGGSRSPVDTLVSKEHLLIEQVKVDRSPLVNEEYFLTSPKRLNPEQQQALDAVAEDIEKQNFAAHLLFGITGSGKTEVYLQAIAKALEKGKSVLMLVPEISLTLQTIERFKSRFEEPIAILHHRLSPGERYDEWHRIKRGEAKIVIGARSAIFSPTPKLGLIIVDEEHEASYKNSEEMPCYNARDVAVMRGKLNNAVVILGSATPSLESYRNVQLGKYKISRLGKRADLAGLPPVIIVNMKQEYEKAKCFTHFSDRLLTEIKKRVQQGEQTILFLNRRGYHTTLQCQSCFEPVKCRHCDVSLTFHKQECSLACHQCGFTLAPPPTNCPGCRSANPMKYKGFGTEHIEKSLRAVFPEVRTLRIDADTTKHKGSHQRLLRDFGTGKADVLIGTQMIAKGLHFPEVTLVGVLNCDAALHIPDFRASEVAFQLMTQVAGRSGRGIKEGLVLFQTAIPDHHVIKHAMRHDYDSFFQEELLARQSFDYPPFQQLVKFGFSGKDLSRVRNAAIAFHHFLLAHLPRSCSLHEPIPAACVKIKDRYRYQILMRAETLTPLTLLMEKKRDQIKKELGAQVMLHIDVNPLSTF